MSEVTRIPRRDWHGDPKAADDLLPLRLRRTVAAWPHIVNVQRNTGQTIQPTALVHEAWLRLTGNENVKWDGRAHFFGAAAEAMPPILIDSAPRPRKRSATAAASSGGTISRRGRSAATAKDDNC